ncbi:MAG: acetyl-CoA acetyltransferase [Gammaproteobacteria bacterium]|nr:acetyl-CoA acetyltransferase [Gammaproteobacteria bacterium]
MNPNTPILIGAAQLVDRSSNPKGRTPIQLMAEVAQNAAQDAGSDQLLADVQHLAAVGLTVDAPGVKTPLTGCYSNVPKSVANALGIDPQHQYYCATGGNTPQQLVNHFANEIAEGRAETVLLTGGEALHTMRQRFNHWSKLLLPKGAWRDKPGGQPTMFGEGKRSNTEHEAKYGLSLPANCYPLFENALRAHYGRSPSGHMQAMGTMFSRMTKVAANNPYAWFATERSADELITVTENNRMIAYPYPKLLNAMISVNQAAAVIMTSVGRAQALGINSDRWVYLHGCAQAQEHWNLTERVNYHSSPALGRAGREALAMADRSINEIDALDIYSCFPSAVQMACDEFGIAHDDPRGLTITGGLPYFGGAGNNYGMHAIAEMMHTLRAAPEQFGLLNANGWFLTKHAVGVYSATPPERDWRPTDPDIYQQKILQATGPVFTETPQGAASIETYTVIYNSINEPQRGIIIGRLDSGQRFMAETESSADVLNDLVRIEGVGRSGEVKHQAGKNTFYLD